MKHLLTAWDRCASVPCVRRHFNILPKCDGLNSTDADPSLEPSGQLAEALCLFKKFHQESNLKAVCQCVNIYIFLLGGSHTNTLEHCSDLAGMPNEVYNVERSLGSYKQYHVLIQLARTLEEQNWYAGDTQDLESATSHGSQALEMCNAENMICPTVCVFYADILLSVFEANTN
jgi:hypothetical protein